MKIGEKVCISVQALYNTYGENLSCCGIDNNSRESSINYYDLYNGFGKLVCMDGEECIIDDIDNKNETVTLINECGEETTTFCLSFEEYGTAVFNG